MRSYMKKSLMLFSGMILTTNIAFAGWQVANPKQTMPRDPFFQAGTQTHKDFSPSSYASKSFPNQYASLGQPAPVYAISVSGSIKRNLERIMGMYHWKVIWKAPYDYKFDGKVTGASLPSVVEKLLDPFPLRAEMFMANKTMAVYPKV